MAQKLVLAIDQGTTGTTCLIVDENLQVLSQGNASFRQIFPAKAWVEHDSKDIWQSVQNAASEAISAAGINAKNIAAIGITNQRETTCLFDKDSEALANFIVWQCKRTTDTCQRLKRQGLEELITERTGLLLDPYFSATKLMWYFSHLDGARKKAAKGQAFFGTIDTWLAHKMTKGEALVTDATNASRTMMMNIESCSWDDELLEIYGIPRECLPKICSSSEIYGYTKDVGFIPDGIPIAGIAGDQQAALFGQACFSAGESKATFGTGCFILLNTGEKLLRSNNGLITSVAIDLGYERQYCFEGSAFIAGAAFLWLRDSLGIIKNESEIESLALSVPDSGGVTFIPALAGLAAPYWRADARGSFSGMSRDTTKAHIARAVLEGITMLNRDIIAAMSNDGETVQSIKVDGGASQNNLLMQMHADFLNINCIRPKMIETTALGVASLAGLATGIYKDRKWLAAAQHDEINFKPQYSARKIAQLNAEWQRALAGA